MELLRERDVEFDVIEYLKMPATREQLEAILAALPDPPADMVRKDKHFKELGLDAGDYDLADTVVGLLLEHPKLMQRPIVIRGDRAAIGRPLENVVALLG